MLLGVNIDHIATLREARKINEPDPLEAVFIAKRAGADQITIHLREDRRHIHDSDVERILQSSFLSVNVECGIEQGIVEFLCRQKPNRVTIVPEKRQEVTTEGGLNLGQSGLRECISEFHKRDISVSLFIDPTLECVEISKDLGADFVELHTGEWANLSLMAHSNLSRTNHSIQKFDLPRANLESMMKESISGLRECAKLGVKNGLIVCAGHGLNYNNIAEICNIVEIKELNIGHSIVARSIFVGLENAIREMLRLIGRNV